MTDKGDTAIFQEEIQKRIAVPEGQFEQFLALWEIRRFGRNEVILKAGKIPAFSIFVLKGCLRQFIINGKGEESIVYFAEERHFIGDLAALRSKTKSIYTFQAIEKCELLTISTENWEQAFIEFPWWAEAHLKGYQKWVIHLQQQMVGLQSLTGEQRYLNLLQAKPGLFQRVPQHFIASYLGISAERLSRIRKKMAGQSIS
ncbi:MAG: Crp/Fnr family transcriptional regulator [Bacteroidota bacterium]